jgi:ATP-binding cassette subfamily C protein
MRAMGVDGIRQVLSGVTVTAAIGGAFSLVNFAMMFYYDGHLTAVAVGLLAILLSITTYFNLRQLRVQRQAFETEGEVAGVLLQLLNGIAKLRVANVEARAFNVWARLFARQRTFLFRGRSITNVVTVTNSIFPIFSSMALFAYVAWKLDSLSIGKFLAFNAAYGQFLASTLAMGAAFTSSLVIEPLYKRLTPILQTLPEIDDVKHAPGTLVGQVDINDVSFRYDPEGPLILNDITVSITPGEFVAFVGPSGSGKSTLFRLLLGFETPENGSIFYDGKDLAGLDVRAVRKQFGVVLQQGALMPGSIFDNIVGSEPLTQDDAWEAARMAGLEDDLKLMPMGMQTMVSEGAGTLSGGQRQRLLIARALVRRPRLILFDEATSALDNRTQEIISHSLEQLNATRIVIAHRLSTIQNADRIFVIEAGRLVQQGTFEELMAVEGAFATLAKRQLV